MKLFSIHFILFFVAMMCNSITSFAQNNISVKDSTSSFSKKDSTISVSKNDSVSKKKIFSPNPKYAVIASAIMPGAGQFYTRKYWKVPLVYAGVGVAAYFFAVNYSGYNNAKQGIAKRIDADASNDLDPIYVRDYNFKKYDISFNSTADLFTVKQYFRKNLDLSVIAFAVVYVLNIVDADVDAHLYNFNMSNDLSFHPLINNSGVGVAFSFK